jgi:hypothetical protein
MSNFTQPNQNYFADAAKRHKITSGQGGDAKWLEEDFKNKTKGLDQDLAFKALDGGRMWGASDQARYDKMVAAKGKAQAHQNGSGKNNQINDNITPGTGPNKPSPYNNDQKNESTNTQEQNVQQDNDINQTIGDNNLVTNNVDNSIRQFGGDNRSMQINTNGKGSLTEQLDGSATAATLGGFYDVDDSPAAQAKFLDMHNTLNRDAQKGFKSASDYSNAAIKRAEKFTKMDSNAFDKRVMARTRSNEASARMAYTDLFGDGNAPDWQRPASPKPTQEPDWDDMYNKFTDF